MSLMRFLAVGKTFGGISDKAGRYRLAANLVPRFGPPPPARQPVARPSPSACRAATAETEAPGVARTAPSRTEVATGPTRVLAALEATLSPKGCAIRRAGIPAVGQKPVRSAPGPIQGELRLEAVRVLRNDLADADLEVVVGAPGVGGDRKPEQARPVLGSDESWSRGRQAGWLAAARSLLLV